MDDRSVNRKRAEKNVLLKKKTRRKQEEDRKKKLWRNAENRE